MESKMVFDDAEPVELNDVSIVNLDTSEVSDEDVDMWNNTNNGEPKKMVVMPMQRANNKPIITIDKRKRDRLLDAARLLNQIADAKTSVLAFEKEIAPVKNELYDCINSRQNANLHNLRLQQIQNAKEDALQKRIDESRAENVASQERMTRVEEEHKKDLAAKKKEVVAVRTILKSSRKEEKTIRKVYKKTLESCEKYKRQYDALMAEDALLRKWTADHGLSVFIRSEPDSSSETILTLENVIPKNPQLRFHILLYTICCGTKNFSVKNVYPQFEGADEVVERANKSEDMVKLVKECIEHWKIQNESSSAENVQNDKPSFLEESSAQ